MEFNEYRLGELVEIYNAKRIPLSTAQRNLQTMKKYPYYGAQGIIDYVEDYIFDGKYLLIAEDGENLRSRNADIALIAEGRFWVNNHAHILKNNSKSNLEVLKFTLNTMDLSGYLTGSAQPKLNKQNLEAISIKLPNIETQNKIGNLIESFEEKIRLNKSIIKKLEEISNSIFKQWFIDFEFPNEQGLPYRSSGGEMVESELGEIPKRWSVELLSTVSEFLSGGTPKTKEESFWNGVIPFFTPKDVDSSIYCNETEKTITDLGLSKCNSRLYPKNTIFITARGTVGKIALSNRDMAMNQSCFALRHKEDKQFYLLGIISNLLREIIQGANGAVFNAINLGDLNRLKFVSTPKELAEQFNELVTPFYNQMSELEWENIKLKELRDSLLPKLLSGEIEIPDESVVES